MNEADFNKKSPEEIQADIISTLNSEPKLSAEAQIVLQNRAAALVSPEEIAVLLRGVTDRSGIDRRVRLMNYDPDIDRRKYAGDQRKSHGFGKESE